MPRRRRCPLSNFRIVRGDSALLGFAVTTETGEPFDLTGCSVTWAASNGSQSLARNFTATDAAEGLGSVALVPADTSSWPVNTPTLLWTLVVTTTDDDVYTVGSGVLEVADGLDQAPAQPAFRAYAGPEDLLAVLPEDIQAQLSAETGDTPDSSVINAVLVDASLVIDGYLGGRYETPITSPGARTILRPHCIVLAKYLLLERRLAGRYDEAGRDIYLQTLAYLKRVADRKAAIQGASDIALDLATSRSTIGSDVIVFSDPQGDSGAGLF